MSLPTRERGLKCCRWEFLPMYYRVAPHAGARIEIPVMITCFSPAMVAPHAGARIEIMRRYSLIWDFMSLPTRERGLKLTKKQGFATCYLSLPTRERGLKLTMVKNIISHVIVAPHAGARIEIRSRTCHPGTACSRSPRGSAD